MQKMAEKINSSLLTKPDLSKKTTISGGNNMMSHQNCASLFSFLWSAILWTYKCKLMLLTRACIHSTFCTYQNRRNSIEYFVFKLSYRNIVLVIDYATNMQYTINCFQLTSCCRRQAFVLLSAYLFVRNSTPLSIIMQCRQSKYGVGLLVNVFCNLRECFIWIAKYSFTNNKFFAWRKMNTAI